MLTLVRNSMRTKKEKKKGFTLVELVIVVAIIAIIAVIAVPQFTTMTANAKASTLETNHNVLVSAVNQYIAANGKLPNDIKDLDSFLAGETGTNGELTTTQAVASFANKPANATYKIGITSSTNTLKITSTLTNVPANFDATNRLGKMSSTSYVCETEIVY